MTVFIVTNRNPASRFESRPDGEYCRCLSCVKRGHGGEAAMWPATSQFFPLHRGRLVLSRCRACMGETVVCKKRRAA